MRRMRRSRSVEYSNLKRVLGIKYWKGSIK
jgi:hypothetical protein